MSWLKTSMKAAVTLVAAVFFWALVGAGFLIVSPIMDAQRIVRDAEIDTRTWQETLPPHVAHALIAVEFQSDSGYVAMANWLTHDGRYPALRGHITRRAAMEMLKRTFTRDQIVDDFARVAYFGREAFGVDAAAALWFGKSADALSASEAAFLASRLKAPNHPDLSAARRDHLLERMHALSYLSDEELRGALAEPLSLAPPP